MFTIQKTGRVYLINDKMFEIPHDIIKSFRTWNICANMMNNTEFDKRLVRIALLMLVTPEDLARGEIEEGTMHFIKGKSVLKLVKYIFCNFLVVPKFQIFYRFALPMTKKEWVF